MSALGLEVAADSIASALAAQQGGAMRVELCGGLDGGGLTPSFGTLAVVRERLQIPLYVLIRPRVGDFVFDAAEVEVMRRDVEQCVRLGCDGVVLGALDPYGQVDMSTMRVLIEAAGSLGVTFHRAIDVSADPARALEDAIELGCERVLTSGARASALEGIETIAALVRQAGERISIMPGAGLSEYNLRTVSEHTGAQEFHASARSVIAAQVQAPHPSIRDLGGDYQRTDVVRVQRMVELLQQR
ncbi:copper homeostasis protein CutC [Xanthomonas hortorum]|uniref:PF03932 family protein CutC n=1 Tax=Xanthomonas hortorum pv. gardneri TaxID=2754056 RepID=A0A6V7CDZ3_9XANT|nr:copper homeostasis protein CutC [Xanthomonas hortorum]MCC4623689.1 copper homeostasis protein CutC [Xanthomonas campestris pv. nigromaculans]APP81512.1 copper homeostasis protein CutC [Xanthomonas hortorum pv. gardneri]EGD21012.1 Copper homeostasis protein [Xanthomonas hortorum ATCC 19865]KLA93741.1 copper homeostasis protein CutC [Xanthomonas hortorum pv. gardneri]KLA97985.1 copper homeostasis protein CutC [Xanthomonas hortorum pv. gardneri]